MVIVILAIVGAIAWIAVTHAFDTARQRATMADMRSLSSAIESYSSEHRLPPPATGSIVDLVGVLTPDHASGLSAEDHWRNRYLYRSDGNGNYWLESFGKDGLDGADISQATRFDFERDIVLANGQFVAAPE